MHDANRIYSLDIETDTRINGLDPRVSRITQVALSTVTGDIVLSAGPFVHDDDPSTPNLDEAALLTDLADTLAGLDAGLILTWNGAAFCLPFLAHRAKVNQVNLGARFHDQPDLPMRPGRPVVPTSRYPQAVTWVAASDRHSHLDITFAFQPVARALGISGGLKPVARAHGIEMIEPDREKMNGYTEEQRQAYMCSDTRGTRALGLHLLGLHALPVAYPGNPIHPGHVAA